jgi:hypothetical protein
LLLVLEDEALDEGAVGVFWVQLAEGLVHLAVEVAVSFDDGVAAVKDAWDPDALGVGTVLVAQGEAAQPIAGLDHCIQQSSGRFNRHP